ncbi:MAG: right-handed parallel beta-helix repeat-containing protein, partial [Ignavibacteriales bacterium]|nr:right-handed parallel beta-helix repeat-containing protein [Ignavibacteriales bacterium]
MNSGVAECKNNLDGDPLFVDKVNGDYHLRSGSPGIDAGDPTFGYSSEPTPNGGRIEIGAYGNTAEATKSGGGGLPNLTNYYVNALTGSNSSGSGAQSTPWKTITYALSQITGSGHTLFVAAGTYNTTLGETFPIVAKDGVSLIGAGMDVSIIDAGNTNIVLRCAGIVDPTTRIEGLTIQGGSLGATPSLGGTGIYISAGSSLTIANNKITGNTNYSGGKGGGMFITNSSPLIVNNLITGNSPGTFGDDVSYGSGMYVDGSTSSPRILSNVITRNKEGGIECAGSSKARIINNTISDNTLDGIIISFAWPDSIINNIISLNSGYGIKEAAATSDPGKVWYNLFYSNGSGVYYD